MSESIVIVGAARTPMGGFQGDFSSLAAHDLGGAAIKAAVERAGIAADAVGEVLFGNCLMAGQGQAPARQAAYKGGLPDSARRRHAEQDVRLGHEGGHDGARHAAGRHARGDGRGRHGEHDQRALPAAQGPRRLPHGPRPHLRPHDARRPGRRLPGRAARWAPSARTARPSTSSRASSRTPLPSPASSAPRHATESGAVQGRDHAGHGQGPRRRHAWSPSTKARARSSSTRSPRSSPAFKKDGTITAASSSSINDGAAALVMMTESHREAARRQAARAHRRRTPRMRSSPSGSPPRRSAPSHKLFAKTGWSVKDVDLWEVNEAFAVVPMALMKELTISHDIVNVHGGACALGHPIGASGARIMVTLIHALQAARQEARRRHAVHRRRRSAPRWRSNCSDMLVIRLA